MPGPTSHGGWRRHIAIDRCGPDEAYGAAGLAAAVAVPLIENGMTLKATSPHYVPSSNYGKSWKRSLAIAHKQVVEGDISTLLWPELTQFLLDMALLRVDDDASPNHQDLYGHVVDHFTVPDPRTYYGVVANSMRLAVSGTGENDARLTLSCIGQREEENDALTEADFDYSTITHVPFMAGFATLWVDARQVADVETWELSVENNISDAPFVWNAAVAAAVRGHAIANLRTIGLTLSKLNNNDEFNAAIRGGGRISFEALFHHPAGHILAIQLPHLYVPQSDEDGSPDRQAMESPRLEAVAGAGDVDIEYAVDLAAGGTSTMSPLTTTAAPV